MRAGSLLLLPGLALAAQAASQTTFQLLGVLPGATYSSALAISRDGGSVVGLSGSHAFLWTSSTGMQDLGVVSGGHTSYANAVSNNGVVVGVCDSFAMEWTQQAGMVSLGALPGDTASVALGVSADGSVIAGLSRRRAGSNFVSTPVMWTGSGITALAAGDATNGSANAVSADGTIIVGVSKNNAFRWTSGTGVQPIALPVPDFASTALSISGSGQFIGGQTGLRGAIRWSAGNAAAFFSPSGPFRQCQGIASNGSNNDNRQSITRRFARQTRRNFQSRVKVR